MSRFDFWEGSRLTSKTVVLLLLGAVFLTGIIYQYIGGNLFESLQIFAILLQGLGGLGTLILAVLYFRQHGVLEDQAETQRRQTDIMDGQLELRQRQLDREVREKHTEILRHRVEEWLGSTPATREDLDEGFNQQSTLPKVRHTEVSSAAKEMFPAGDDKFLVAPSWLEDEKYFRDLLENHAPELRELKNRIENLEAELSEQRKQFIADTAEPERVDTEEYVIKPGYNFGKWVFQQIVLKERGFESFDDLYERASAVPEATASGSGDSTIYPGEDIYAAPFGVVQVRSKTEDYEGVSENRDEIEEKITSMLQSVIRDIEEVESYDSAKAAAETLDELSEVVAELQFKLNEYQGLPLYNGTCEYLEAERID